MKPSVCSIAVLLLGIISSASAQTIEVNQQMIDAAKAQAEYWKAAKEAAEAQNSVAAAREKGTLDQLAALAALGTGAPSNEVSVAALQSAPPEAVAEVVKMLDRLASDLCERLKGDLTNKSVVLTSFNPVPVVLDELRAFRTTGGYLLVAIEAARNKALTKIMDSKALGAEDSEEVRKLLGDSNEFTTLSAVEAAALLAAAKGVASLFATDLAITSFDLGKMDDLASAFVSSHLCNGGLRVFTSRDGYFSSLPHVPAVRPVKENELWQLEATELTAAQLINASIRRKAQIDEAIAFIEGRIKQVPNPPTDASPPEALKALNEVRELLVQASSELGSFLNPLHAKDSGIALITKIALQERIVQNINFDNPKFYQLALAADVSRGAIEAEKNWFGTRRKGLDIVVTLRFQLTDVDGRIVKTGVGVGYGRKKILRLKEREIHGSDSADRWTDWSPLAQIPDDPNS